MLFRLPSIPVMFSKEIFFAALFIVVSDFHFGIFFTSYAFVYFMKLSSFLWHLTLLYEAGLFTRLFFRKFQGISPTELNNFFALLPNVKNFHVSARQVNNYYIYCCNFNKKLMDFRGRQVCNYYVY